MDLPKVNVYARLFDFYTPLLTKRQQQVFNLYYFQDFSLGEISQELNISRQAVFDLIKRTEKVLENYEQKLQLLEKYQQDHKIIQTIRKIIENSQLQREDQGHILKLLDEML
ncbi:MAG: YlxM family DNA-binding protein [Bacillota bacterium]